MKSKTPLLRHSSLLVVVLACAFSASQPIYASSPEPPSNLGMQGAVIVSFNDRSVFRRTELDAPTMGSGLEDFIVRIACLDQQDCKARIPHLIRLLKGGKEISQVCGRAFARIVVAPEDYGSGSEVETYDVDFSGTCVTKGARAFKLRTSIFALLNLKLSKW